MKHTLEEPTANIEVCEYSVDFPKTLRPSHRGSRIEIIAPPRVPRLAKLMALAIRFDRLLADGAVYDYAEIARLGHVTRSRLTQIMGMLFLAPDIQEHILHLPTVAGGEPDAVTERHVRTILSSIEWKQQRRLWRAVVGGKRQRT